MTDAVLAQQQVQQLQEEQEALLQRILPQQVINVLLDFDGKRAARRQGASGAGASSTHADLHASHTCLACSSGGHASPHAGAPHAAHASGGHAAPCSKPHHGHARVKASHSQLQGIGTFKSSPDFACISGTCDGQSSTCDEYRAQGCSPAFSSPFASMSGTASPAAGTPRAAAAEAARAGGSGSCLSPGSERLHVLLKDGEECAPCEEPGERFESSLKIAKCRCRMKVLLTGRLDVPAFLLRPLLRGCRVLVPFCCC